MESAGNPGTQGTPSSQPQTQVKTPEKSPQNSSPRNKPEPKSQGDGLGSTFSQAAKAVEGGGGQERSLADQIESGDSEHDSEELSGGKEPQENNSEEGKETADKKFKIKYKGKELEVSEPQMIKLAEQGHRMYQAMEETATYRKQNQEFQGLFEQVRTSPEAWLEMGRALGHNVDELAHKIVIERMKYEGLDEKDRKIFDLERETKSYREQQELSKKQQEEQTQKQAATQAKEKAENEVLDFFKEKYPKGKPNLDVLSQTIEIVLGSFRADGSRLPVAKAYEIAQNRLKASKLSTLKELSDEDLDTLPESVIERIRQREIQRFKQSRQSGTPERQTQQQEPASKPRTKTLTMDEYFAELDKKYS